MSNTIFVLERREVILVNGGNLIEAGRKFAESFLDAGTAFALNGIITELKTRYCANVLSSSGSTPGSNVTAQVPLIVCEVIQELTGIIGFSLHSLIPAIYVGLEDPILPRRKTE